MDPGRSLKNHSSDFEQQRAASPIGALPAPRNLRADLTEFPIQVWKGARPTGSA